MVDSSETKMMVNEEYIHSLVKMMSPVKKSKTPGAEAGKTMIGGGQCTGQQMEFCMAGDRPQIQFCERAGREAPKPYRGWKLVGYLATTMEVHLVMRSQSKNNSFRNRARGLTSAPVF